MFELGASLIQICGVHNVIAVEYFARLVPGDRHGNLLKSVTDPGSIHSANIELAPVTPVVPKA